MYEVHQWNDIAADFQEALVLGNGASVAVHSDFRYGSLKEEAKARGLLISDEDREAEAGDAYNVEEIFQLLGTLLQPYRNRASFWPVS
jgi:hypothetical protein